MGVDFKSLTEATSGAVGGLVSTTVLYPLDTCKTIYQVESASSINRRYNSLWDVFKEAVENNNLGALYQGLGTKNVQSVISQFVYFYSYSFLKEAYLAKKGKKSMGMLVNMAVAAAAGAVTTIVIQPLDTASARIQTSRFGQSQSLWRTLRSGSWREAYDGLVPSLLLTSNPAIQYTVFEQLKERMLRHRQSQTLSVSSAFLLGAFSKSVATVLTYPAIRCKVLIQTGRPRPKTMVEAMLLVWRTEGALGFFKGLNAQIVKTVLSAAIMLAIKEKTAEATLLVMLAARRWSLIILHVVARQLLSGRKAYVNEKAPRMSISVLPTFSSLTWVTSQAPEIVRRLKTIQVTFPATENYKVAITWDFND